MSFKELSAEEERIGTAIVNAAYHVHKELGPGLLEKVYEACMAYELRKNGFDVKRQVYIPIFYDGMEFDEGFRLDMLVNDLVVSELKSVEILNPLWEAQIISHLKLMKLTLGYLINFNVPIIKKGIRRFRNG